MRRVTLIVDWGGITKEIEVSEVFGNWNGGCYVYIDRYYNGKITLIDGEWRPNLHPECELTMDDVQILGTLIDDAPAGRAS